MAQEQSYSRLVVQCRKFRLHYSLRDKNTTLLHLVSIYNLISVLNTMRDSRKVIDADNNINGSRTSLDLAAEKGHEMVVELLLDVGAGTDGNGKIYINALIAAIAHDRKNVVAALLKRGVDIGVTGGNNRNVLQAIASNEYIRSGRTLSKRGFETETPSGRVRAMLIAALRVNEGEIDIDPEERVQVVQRLIDSHRNLCREGH